MEYYGIHGIVLNWRHNYISNRKQLHSTTNNLWSSPRIHSWTNVLFIIYINDIVNSSKLAKFIIIADDTNLFCKQKDLKTLTSLFTNSELLKISNWFKLNKLSLNINKTNYIYFHSSTHCHKDNLDLKLITDNVQINRVNNTKFLGVIVNSTLTWHVHIKIICGKISKSIGIITKISCNLPNTTLTILYHALVQRYLEYCDIIWATDSSSSTALASLFCTQKRAIRVI